MDKKPAARPSPEGSEAPLPADRAFVVQFRPQGDPAGELFVGRVEHIASGAAARFASSADLLAFVSNLLAPAETREDGSPVIAKRGKTE